ncbi:hypothetical protein JW905_18900 [bacterium]|nr:hypothetical protein [candidate division CSSED10-310 bacterium]
MDRFRPKKSAARLVAVGCFLMVVTLVYLHPAMNRFTTGTIGAGDAWQTVWNFWWLDQCLFHRPHNPFFTDLLFYPGGAYLYFHTHGFLNALIALPVIELWGPVAGYNSMVVFSFLSTGLLMFLLVRRITGDSAAAVLGSVIFTFCPYRLEHSTGHLNLISTAWFPLIAMALPWALLHRRRWPCLVAAGTLAAVPFTTYYYLIYMVLLAGALILDCRGQAVDISGHITRGRRGLAVLCLAGILLAPYVLAMYCSLHTHPVAEGHDPASFSADLQSFFIPSGISAYGKPFESIRGRWTGERVEQSAYLGYTVLVLCIAGFFIRDRRLRIWKLLAPFSLVMALGPGLRIGGTPIGPALLPYNILLLIPPLRLGGVPSRFVSLALFAMAVIAAVTMARLRQRLSGSGQLRWLLTGGIIVLVLAEYFPAAFPTQELAIPAFYHDLAAEAGEFALLDHQNPLSAMFCQTVHGRPIVGGYLSRNPSPGMEVLYHTPFISDLWFADPHVEFAMERIDGPIAFAWGEGSPAPNINPDRFSVTWEGRLIVPVTDTYRISTTSDDGIRVWLGEEVVISNLEPHAPEWNHGEVRLEAGSIPIFIEYTEVGGSTLCELYWSTGQRPMELVPVEHLRTPAGQPGLRGVYYNHVKPLFGWRRMLGTYLRDINGYQGLTKLFFVKTMNGSTRTIYSADWMPELVPSQWPEPASGTNEEIESCTVRWQGQLYAPLTGEYGFRMNSVNPCELQIDGRIVRTTLRVRDADGGDGAVWLQAGYHDVVMLLTWVTRSDQFSLDWRLPPYDPATLLRGMNIRYIVTTMDDDLSMLNLTPGLELAGQVEKWHLYRVTSPTVRL